MASETTVYDVVTRYIIDDRSSTSMARVERSARSLGTALSAGERTFRSFAAGLGTLTRYAAPLVGLGTAAEAARRTFSGLNEEAERTLQLGSSFNLAFQFDADPARQFTSSMREARKLVSGIIEDAARLPGSSKDFFGIAAITAGPIFRAGGDPAAVRRMLGNLAMVAPFVGQTAGDAGAGAMRTLTGQAGADIPLFQNLASAGLLPRAEQYNAQTAAQRFQQLDRALERLVGNPFFRGEVDKLMATQLGTLEDLLFGPKGIGGTVARGAFEAFGSSLASFNRSLQENTPAIVGALRTMGASFGFFKGLWGMIPGMGHLGQTLAAAGYKVQAGSARDSLLEAAGISGDAAMSRYYSGRILGGGRVGHTGESVIAAYVESLYRGAAQPGSGYDAETVERAMRAAGLDLTKERENGRRTVTGGSVLPFPQEMIGTVQRAFIRELELTRQPFAGERRDDVALATNVTKQTFNIKIDLKSDTSPESIAVKFQQAMEMAARRPTRSARALPVGPGPSAAR